MALLVSALIFFLVSQKSSPSAVTYHHLPRFFNTAPEDAPTLALRSLQKLQVKDDPDAAALLAHLGGAALPSVLPALEGLSPPARFRIVLSLRPVAARMGLSPNTSSPDQEILWWRHFWEDYALDFHTATVRRLVRRYATNPTPTRLQELRRLDTAALPELFVLLGIDGPIPPAALSSALLPVIQQTLQRPATPPEQTSQEVLDLRAFWFAHRIEFSSLSGAARASSLLLETQYGKWVERTLLERALRSPRAPVQASSPLRTLLRRGPQTLTRLLQGIALSVVLTEILRRFRRFLPLKLVAALSLSFLPLGLLWAPPSNAMLIMILAMAWLPWMLGRREELHFWADLRPERVAEQAQGLRFQRRNLWIWIGHGVSIDLGFALTILLLLEWRWRLPGLGNLLANALRTQDATLLMSFAVASAVFLQVVSIGVDTLAPWLDPRRDRIS